MSYAEEIYASALLYLGCEDEEEKSLLQSFSSAAEREMTARLRDGSLPEDCSEEFIMGSACLACAMFLACRPKSGSFTSFTAGEISVSRANAESTAEQVKTYREMAEIFMLGLVKDGGFEFRSVRG